MSVFFDQGLQVLVSQPFSRLLGTQLRELSKGYAELGLKVAKSQKGRTHSVDIAATDRNGHRQLQPAARSIRVNP